MPDQFEGHKNRFVSRMFLATADQNYIIARWAALNDLYLDFFWMGLHAVEKYLKAILLFNGESAICYGHNIERLSRAVLGLHRMLSWGQFQKPNVIGPSTTLADFEGRGIPKSVFL